MQIERNSKGDIWTSEIWSTQMAFQRIWPGGKWRAKPHRSELCKRPTWGKTRWNQIARTSLGQSGRHNFNILSPVNGSDHQKGDTTPPCLNLGSSGTWLAHLTRREAHLPIKVWHQPRIDRRKIKTSKERVDHPPTWTSFGTYGN